jgi:hypothetical protein
MENPMNAFEQGKKATDQAAGAARETLRKGETKAEQSLQAAQEGFQMAGNGAREVNLKLIEIMRSNAEAFFGFAEEMATAKDPGSLVEIWSKHTRQQMEMLSKHSQEFASLGQRLATTNMQSVSNPIR